VTVRDNCQQVEEGEGEPAEGEPVEGEGEPAEGEPVEGEATLEPPILKTAPADGAILEGTYVKLEVEWYLLDSNEHVFYQIARDEAFTMLLEKYDTSGQAAWYYFYEDGTYYWRIRRENYDGAYSDWITRSFTVKILEEEEEAHAPKKLTIYVTPENSGEVISNPEMPPEGYPYETSVTLTAIAKQGYKFVQWDRSDDPKPQTSSILKLSLDEDITVSAVFAYLEDGSGCFSNCRKTKSTTDNVKRMIGDWLLIGLSLTVLLAMTKQ